MSQSQAKQQRQQTRHRVRIYIPAYYEIFGRDELFQTLHDAIQGLEVDGFKFQDDPESDGAYLYLFSGIFPQVDEGDETPDGQLWLSASEGWKVKWSQKIQSSIVTLH